MEKALNLRLFTKTRDHPPWRSGYVAMFNSKVPGSISTNDLLFPFFLFFFFFVLFCLLICFAVFFFCCFEIYT